METSPIRVCEHVNCGHGNKIEYCLEEAINPEGYVGLVMERVDYMLPLDNTDQYDKRAFRRSRNAFGGDDWLNITDGLYEEGRSISFHPDPANPGFVKTISIERISDQYSGHKLYFIDVDWKVGGKELVFKRSYSIENYEGGFVRGIIKQPDLLEGYDATFDEDMKPFDYTSLEAELREAQELAMLE